MWPLPPFLYKFFWDTDPSRLDARRDRSFILERLLELGDDEAVHWLLSTYPREEIEEVVRYSRRLSRKTANFWALRYGLPQEEIRCLRTPSPPKEEPF
ncbi:MAG: hypothetical protein QJR13_09405 [Bacillota bacterium]|nr:hypothetical protein [Bacillota bacterium]